MCPSPPLPLPVHSNRRLTDAACPRLPPDSCLDSVCTVAWVSTQININELDEMCRQFETFLEPQFMRRAKANAFKCVDDNILKLLSPSMHGTASPPCPTNASCAPSPGDDMPAEQSDSADEAWNVDANDPDDLSGATDWLSAII